MTMSFTTAFPDGVSVGGVTQKSAGLWTQVVETLRLRLQVGTNPSFQHIIETENAVATDPPAPARIEGRPLKPGAKYDCRFMWREIIVATALVQMLSGVALAQDRPLLEPLRIGHVKAELVADDLRNSVSLEAALRRKGFIPVWREFADGLAAVRSLDAGDVDLTLSIPLNDVVAAKRENLTMVFIAELRSAAPACCDMGQLFADDRSKRYSLSSEYLADCREDILLILHKETIKVLQRLSGYYIPRAGPPGSTPVARDDRLYSPRADYASPVTRASMQEASKMTRERLHDNTIDIADVNYWAPRLD
jgi:hypothetical protein